MRLEDVDRIIPLGMMVGGHVMPIDHQYYFPKKLAVKHDVFSPADGHIVMIGHRVLLTGSTERKRDYDDYAVHIEHTGTLYTVYDLLTELDPAIWKLLDETWQLVEDMKTFTRYVEDEMVKFLPDAK